MFRNNFRLRFGRTSHHLPGAYDPAQDFIHWFGRSSHHLPDAWSLMARILLKISLMRELSRDKEWSCERESSRLAICRRQLVFAAGQWPDFLGKKYGPFHWSCTSPYTATWCLTLGAKKISNVNVEQARNLRRQLVFAAPALASREVQPGEIRFWGSSSREGHGHPLSNVFILIHFMELCKMHFSCSNVSQRIKFRSDELLWRCLLTK